MWNNIWSITNVNIFIILNTDHGLGIALQDKEKKK